MSYARFGESSDVYVFETPGGCFECCGCMLLSTTEIDDFVSFVVETRGEMIGHLQQHRLTGYTVPQKAFDRLQTEVDYA